MSRARDRVGRHGNTASTIRYSSYCFRMNVSGHGVAGGLGWASDLLATLHVVKAAAEDLRAKRNAGESHAGDDHRRPDGAGLTPGSLSQPDADAGVPCVILQIGTPARRLAGRGSPGSLGQV